jgi:uncharacterized protein (DUF1778 family)
VPDGYHGGEASAGLTVRIPPDLKARLAEAVRLRETTFTKFCIRALEREIERAMEEREAKGAARG